MTLEDFMRICAEEGFDCYLAATMPRADGGVERVGFTLSPIFTAGTRSSEDEDGERRIVRAELRRHSILAHSFRPEDMVR